MAKSEVYDAGAEQEDAQRLLGRVDRSSDDDDATQILGVELRRRTRELAKRKRILFLLIIVNAVIALFLCALTLKSVFFPRFQDAGLPWNYKTDKNQLLKQMSYYSPYYDMVEMSIEETQVDGSFVGSSYPTPFYLRGPSPEIDAAWDRLSTFRYVILTEEEVSQLGKDPKLSAKAPPSWGYGDDAYVSRPDITHRLHCLNMLRKASYPEEVYSHLRDGEEETRVLWQPHVSHCVNVLLQHLMCTATLEAVTLTWMEDMDYPQPDFNINRKCINMDAFMDWQDKDGVPDVRNNATMLRDFLALGVTAPKIPIPQPYLDLLNGTDPQHVAF